MHRLQTRWVVAIWLVILTVISVRVVISVRANSVYPIFSDAGRKWLQGSNLYGQQSANLDLFRYCPAVAAGFAPLSLLPDQLGGVIWRWINAIGYVGALALWCQIWRRTQIETAAVLLLALPLAIGGLNNGQCNALVAGLMLIAAVIFGRDRWTLAAAALTVAVLFKVYPLALGLLFCLLEPRRFAPRMALALLIGYTLPYLFQRFDYVSGQYTSLVNILQIEDRTHWPIEAGYRDLHMLLRRFGWQTSLGTYRLIEVLTGMACAAIVIAGRLRGWDKWKSIDACLALGSIWMTLCGPATESSTYVLLAPVLAKAMIVVEARAWFQRLFVYASFGLFMLGGVIVWFPLWITHIIQTAGVQPIAACLLLTHVLVECWQTEPAIGTTLIETYMVPPKRREFELTALTPAVDDAICRVCRP